MTTQLTTTVRAVSDKVRIIDVQGDLTAQSEEMLANAYDEASNNGAKAIILNFEGLDYMNSSGIGLLVTMLIRVQRNKQRLLAYGLTDHLFLTSEKCAIWPIKMSPLADTKRPYGH